MKGKGTNQTAWVPSVGFYSKVTSRYCFNIEGREVTLHNGMCV